MPELPEVEACRRDLLRWTDGRTITDLTVEDPAAIRYKLSTLTTDILVDGGDIVRSTVIGTQTERIDRHGKRLAWRFRDRPMGLLLFLSMTGRWVRRPQNEPLSKRVRLNFVLDDGYAVWFEDTRRFACVTPVPVEDLATALAVGHGPDALLQPVDAATLRERLNTKRAIKVALLDQTVLAGLGNIHAAESLFRAKIHPDTPANELTSAQLQALAAAIPVQLAPFLEHSLGDDPTYVNLGGENPFSIYQRKGEPCPVCSTPIERQVQAGRSTFWCPSCQR